MKRKQREEGPSPLEWIESALQLLRSAPAGALLCYYIGSAPCLLGLLYFWADMSQAASASSHLLESSLTAAALYIWMKCWQTVFLSKLRAHLFMEAEAPWTLTRVARLLVAQAALQPAGLFLRLLAAQLLLPYIWTYSLFAGLAILGDGTEPSLRAILRGAVREAGLWWRETHLALLCLFGFAFFICVNINVVCGLLPMLIHMLLGIETVFSRDGWKMFNSTFFAATFAATYLCFDPLRKAVFLVRHFHGQSLRSGEDLRVELRSLRERSNLALAAVLLASTLLAGLTPATRAAEAPPPPGTAAPAHASVDAQRLNVALDHVLERREYAWRFPREAQAQSEEKGWLSGFLEGVAKAIARQLRKVQHAVNDFIDWLRQRFESDRDTEAKAPFNLDWGTVARGTLILLATVLLILLIVLLLRARRGRRRVVTAQPVTAVPDLTQEGVTADQLPEEGWLQLARDLIAKAEWRLALRAFYLASLAHLGQRELLLLQRFKTDRDYDRELRRRARGNRVLLTAFDENLLVFERAWYGDHAVTSIIVDDFSQNLERMRTC